MAYTILGAWDFRTTDSTAARTSRRHDGGGGPYVLAEAGTVSYTADGVVLADVSADRLSMTVPAGLKFAGAGGFLIAFRRTAAVSAGNELLRTVNTSMTGGEYGGASFIYLSGTQFQIWTNNGTSSSGATGTVAFPAVDTDYVFAVKRSSISTFTGFRSPDAAMPTITTIATWQTWSGSDILRFCGPHRIAWVLWFDGDMDSTEFAAIVASPDDFLHSAPSGIAKSVFPFFLR